MLNICLENQKLMEKIEKYKKRIAGKAILKEKV